jgi:hypothetical protein
MARKKGGWFKPYVLNPHNIEKVVSSKVPGVYVLGNKGADKRFRIEHIKSSGDVKSELKRALGKYHIFMYKPLKHQLETFRQGQASLQLV